MIKSFFRARLSALICFEIAKLGSLSTLSVFFAASSTGFALRSSNLTWIASGQTVSVNLVNLVYCIVCVTMRFWHCPRRYSLPNSDFPRKFQISRLNSNFPRICRWPAAGLPQACRRPGRSASSATPAAGLASKSTSATHCGRMQH